jgi:predicted metal-dependent phosphoesterase TrpH
MPAGADCARRPGPRAPVADSRSRGPGPRRGAGVASTAAAGALSLVEVLQGVHGGSCPGELNFHCHTLHSDGSLRPEDLARQAVDLGLRHLAITDHHSTAALAPAQHCLEQLAAQGRPGPRLWSGIEISCLLEGCLVHVLGLDFEPQARALEPYRQGQAPVGPELKAKEVVKRLHGAGGLALLAHPGRYRKPFGLLIDAAADLGFDGAEAYYDYAMAERWQPTPLVCEAIANQLQNLGLLRSCGTDTHGLALHGR